MSSGRARSRSPPRVERSVPPLAVAPAAPGCCRFCGDITLRRRVLHWQGTPLACSPCWAATQLLRPLCEATLPWTYQEADVAAEALAQVRLLVLRRRQRLAGSGFVPRQSP